MTANEFYSYQIYSVNNCKQRKNIGHDYMCPIGKNIMLSTPVEWNEELSLYHLRKECEQRCTYVAVLRMDETVFTTQ